MQENYLEFTGKKTKESYFYHIKTDSASSNITIVFIDGEFDHVEFPFSGSYSRKEWKILAEINLKIEGLEKSNKKGMVK